MNKLKISILIIAFALMFTACSDEESSSSLESSPAPSSSVESSSSMPQEASSAPMQSESSTASSSSSETTTPSSTPSSEAEVEEVVEADPIEVTLTELDSGVTVTFSRLPTSLEDVTAITTDNMSSPHFIAATYVAIMCSYENDLDETLEMWEYLNGVEELSAYDKEFIRDRLTDKIYKPYSYFIGTSPENDYQATAPYSITISENPYTYDEDSYARFVLQSSGADSERFMTVRHKESTDEWFYWEDALFADIRIPKSEDDWA